MFIPLMKLDMASDGSANVNRAPVTSARPPLMMMMVVAMMCAGSPALFLGLAALNLPHLGLLG